MVDLHFWSSYPTYERDKENNLNLLPFNVLKSRGDVYLCLGTRLLQFSITTSREICLKVTNLPLLSYHAALEILSPTTNIHCDLPADLLEIDRSRSSFLNVISFPTPGSTG